MAIREILTIPDPVLRDVCAPVETIDDGVQALIDDMFDTMYDAPGIGLAAIQIGVLSRVVTIDVSKGETPPNPMVLINPEIVSTSGDPVVHEEGCLSIPDYYEEIARPEKCVARFTDREGNPQEIEAEGLLAYCIQHEVDHLNGVLFIDYLSRLKKQLVMRKFTKAKRKAMA